jgi:hypothetical protein
MLVGGIISSVRARRAGSAVEVPKVSSAEDA